MMRTSMNCGRGLDGDGVRRELVLAPTSSPRVFRQQDSYREHTSTTHIGNAMGQSLPPVLCFEGKLLDADIAEQVSQWDEHALYGVQENGYFTNSHTLQLLQHIDQHAVKARPLLLILDGAKGHIDLDAAQFAVKRRIRILLLPSNCTHFLQVADVSVFVRSSITGNRSASGSSWREPFPRPVLISASSARTLFASSGCMGSCSDA